jgi:segregation and condensation protein A
MDNSSHNAENEPDFEDDGGAPRSNGGLFLKLEGYEGPIDLLLDLARDQKVDLSQISILALVDQYLRFMHMAKKRRLDLAAEYLVMAAWLVYLKSKILLPSTAEEAIAAAESAEAIAFRLQRLAAMQKAAEEVFNLPQRGDQRFERGPVFKIKSRVETRLDVELYHLLRAYALVQNRHTAVDRAVRKIPVYSLEEAVKNLSRLGWPTHPKLAHLVIVHADQYQLAQQAPLGARIVLRCQSGISAARGDFSAPRGCVWRHLPENTRRAGIRP